MRKIILTGIGLALCALMAQDKMIIAHRGASAYLPEHTLESKVLAYGMGVPYLEQDLAMTKDNHLLVVHDHYLDRVSDVAKKFPGRARADGRYYVIDFTLDEIKTLAYTEGFEEKNGKQIQKYPKRFPMHTSYFTFHTFEEEIELIQGMNKTMNKDVGLYVEIKAPWFHKQEGKDIAKATLEVLKKYGYTTKESKAILQTFDYPDLIRIKEELMPSMGVYVKTVALIANDPRETYEFKNGKWQPFDFNYLRNANNMQEIAKYADGLGPHYGMLFDSASTKGAIIVNDFVANAHKYGLVVHPYTIRADVLPAYVDNVNELFEAVLYKAGADGVFTDFPDIGLAFIKQK